MLLCIICIETYISVPKLILYISHRKKWPWLRMIITTTSFRVHHFELTQRIIMSIPMDPNT